MHSLFFFKILIDFLPMIISQSHFCRYYSTSPNVGGLFESPVLIETPEDVDEKVAKILDTHDLVEFLQRLRPNSEWYVYRVTNFTIFIYHLPDHPLGSPLKLPAYILRNKGLLSFTRTSKGKRHRYSLCLLRYIFNITSLIYR